MMQAMLHAPVRRIRPRSSRRERRSTFRFAGMLPIGCRVVLLGDPEESLGVVTGYNPGTDPYYPSDLYPISVHFPHGESYHRLDMILPVDKISCW